MEVETGGPGLGNYTPARERLLGTDRGQDHQAPTPEATELADRALRECPTAGDVALGEAAQLRCRARRLGLRADTDGPQGGNREGQPQALCPGRIEHLGLLPVPAAPFAVFEARSPYHATSAADGGRSVSTNHGSRYPASQRASSVQDSWRAGVAKQTTGPAHRWPIWPTTWVRGRKVVAVWGRYWPWRLMRRNGCHPSC